MYGAPGASNALGNRRPLTASIGRKVPINTAKKAGVRIAAPKSGPVALSSRRSENNGFDPSVNVVPTGGAGWGGSSSAPGAPPVSAGLSTDASLHPQQAAPPVQSAGGASYGLQQSSGNFVSSRQGQTTGSSSGFSSAPRPQPTQNAYSHNRPYGGESRFREEFPDLREVKHGRTDAESLRPQTSADNRRGTSAPRMEYDYVRGQRSAANDFDDYHHHNGNYGNSVDPAHKPGDYGQHRDREESHQGWGRPSGSAYRPPDARGYSSGMHAPWRQSSQDRSPGNTTGMERGPGFARKSDYTPPSKPSPAVSMTDDWAASDSEDDDAGYGVVGKPRPTSSAGGMLPLGASPPSSDPVRDPKVAQLQDLARLKQLKLEQERQAAERRVAESQEQLPAPAFKDEYEYDRAQSQFGEDSRDVAQPRGVPNAQHHTRRPWEEPVRDRSWQAQSTGRHHQSQQDGNPQNGHRFYSSQRSPALNSMSGGEEPQSDDGMDMQSRLDAESFPRPKKGVLFNPVSGQREEVRSGASQNKRKSSPQLRAQDGSGFQGSRTDRESEAKAGRNGDVQAHGDRADMRVLTRTRVVPGQRKLGRTPQRLEWLESARQERNSRRQEKQSRQSQMKGLPPPPSQRTSGLPPASAPKSSKAPSPKLAPKQAWGAGSSSANEQDSGAPATAVSVSAADTSTNTETEADAFTAATAAQLAEATLHEEEEDDSAAYANSAAESALKDEDQHHVQQSFMGTGTSTVWAPLYAVPVQQFSTDAFLPSQSSTSSPWVSENRSAGLPAMHGSEWGVNPISSSSEQNLAGSMSSFGQSGHPPTRSAAWGVLSAQPNSQEQVSGGMLEGAFDSAPAREVLLGDEFNSKLDGQSDKAAENKAKRKAQRQKKKDKSKEQQRNTGQEAKDEDSSKTVKQAVDAAPVDNGDKVQGLDQSGPPKPGKNKKKPIKKDQKEKDAKSKTGTSDQKVPQPDSQSNSRDKPKSGKTSAGGSAPMSQQASSQDGAEGASAAKPKPRRNKPSKGKPSKFSGKEGMPAAPAGSQN